MKLFRMIPRYFRDAFKSVFRNFSLSIASIMCIIVTLALVSVAMILTSNINKFTDNIKDDVTIHVYIESETDDETVREMKKRFEKKDTNIESIQLITKDERKEKYMTTDETFKNIISTWGDGKNPLRHEMIIRVKSLEDIKKSAEMVEKTTNVVDVQYGEGMVEQLVHVFKVVKNATIVTVIALIVVTAFLITNTIKLTIFSRKREIEIMRLVGASNITVKLPFIIEGFVLGILGSIIPIIATIYGYKSLYTFFNGKIIESFGQLVKPDPYVYTLSLLLLGIGALVGMFSSGQAVRKYLKV